MKRDSCFHILAGLLPNDIVVATYTSAFEWMAIRPHPLNYLSVGAMGLASSHALGLALALPGRRIVVLDGDGSLLMNLGSLVTVAAARPANLVHVVCQNGTYEANGGHPIPGLGDVDFTALARAAGYAHAAEFSQLEDFRRGIGKVLAIPGPVFVNLHLEPGDTTAPADYEFIHGERTRREFAAALAAGRQDGIYHNHNQ